MSLDLRTLTEALNIMEEPQMFLRGVFFPDTRVHNTRHVDMQIQVVPRTLGRFVNPMMPAVAEPDPMIRLLSMHPPTIKYKAVLTPNVFLTAKLGDHVYTLDARTPNQAALDNVGIKLREGLNQVAMTIEWMCAQVLCGGKIHILGQGVDTELDFGMKPSNIFTVPQLTNAVDWSDPTSEPLTDLRLMYDSIIKNPSGLTPEVVILGSRAYHAFMAHPTVTASYSLFDKERVDVGNINLQLRSDNVLYVGELREFGVRVYRYNNYYSDNSGVPIPIFPDSAVVMGSTKAKNCVHFGAIEDIQAPSTEKGFNSIGLDNQNILLAVKYMGKTWYDNDPSALNLLVQSSPIAALQQPDAFSFATVV